MIPYIIHLIGGPWSLLISKPDLWWAMFLKIPQCFKPRETGAENLEQVRCYEQQKIRKLWEHSTVQTRIMRGIPTSSLDFPIGTCSNYHVGCSTWSTEKNITKPPPGWAPVSPKPGHWRPLRRDCESSSLIIGMTWPFKKWPKIEDNDISH